MSRSWVVVAFLCAGVAIAGAKPTKVALTISNDSDGIRKAVAGALDDTEVELVSAKKTHRAIERLGLDDVASASDAKKLAHELDVDTVVGGNFDADQRKLKLTIFTNGKKHGSFSVVVDDSKSKFKKKVRAKMLAKLDASDDAGAKPEADRPEPKPDDTKVADAHPPSKKRVASASDVRSDTEEPPGSVHAIADAPPSTTRGANLAMIRIDASGTFTRRTFQIDGSTTGTYKSSGAGGRFAAELFPMSSGPLAGFGLAAEYEQTKSTAAIDRHYAVGARYRIAFGHAPTSPTATLGIAYGARTLKLDRAMAPADIPDVDYRMIVPGLDVRVPLGTRVAIVAGGEALLLRSAGAIATPEQYGGAHVVAYGFSAGLDIIVASHVALQLSAQDTKLAMTFYDNGTMSTPHATDTYLGAAATLALFY